MRLVLDTNVVIAGLLWHGTPRRLLDQTINDDTVELYSSPTLIDELGNALGYPKFTPRIARYETTVETLVAQYRALLILVSPLHTPAWWPAIPMMMKYLLWPSPLRLT